MDKTSSKIQRWKLQLKRYWWILLCGVSIGVVIQGYKIQKIPVSYQSHAVLQWLPVQSLAREVISDSFHNFINQRNILQSKVVKERALEILEVYHEDVKIYPVRTEIVIPASRRESSPSMMTIIVSSGNRGFPQVYLAALLQAHKAYLDDLKKDTSNVQIELITRQMNQLEGKIGSVEKELTEFEKEHNTAKLAEGVNENNAYLKTLKSKKKTLETHLRKLKALTLDEVASSRGSGSGESDSGDKDSEKEGAENENFLSRIVSLGPIASYISSRRDLELLNVEKGNLQAIYREKHPRMISLRKRIERKKLILGLNRRESLEKIEREKEILRKELFAINKEIKIWTKKALEMGSILSEHRALQSKISRLNNRSERYLEVLQNIDAGNKLGQDNIRVMESPTFPSVVRKEKIKPLVTGGMLGLLVGFALIFLIDKLDDRINNTGDFQAHFSEAILGQVPTQKHGKSSASLPALSVNDSRHGYVEAFRNLRSSLLFKQWNGPKPRTFLVTSAIPGEGKTTVASNLAITMAISGAKVLLVDTDLRKGRLQEIFTSEEKKGENSESDNTFGLSDFLEKKAHWRECVCSTQIEGLFFMPKGSCEKFSAEQFLSPEMDSFIEETKKRYDFVIYDAAPVLVADDTMNIAPRIDAALYILRLQSTKKRAVFKALEFLYSRQTSLAGVIMNFVSSDRGDYPYYYRKGGYGYTYSTYGGYKSRETKKEPSKA